jgi:hypothetical protein
VADVGRVRRGDGGRREVEEGVQVGDVAVLVDAADDTDAPNQEWLVGAHDLHVRPANTDPSPGLRRIEFIHGVRRRHRPSP